MPRICITTPNTTPQPYRFPTDTEAVSIGRSAANDVVIDHGSISSHHCEMKRAQGGFVLVDLDSTNGIYLDEVQMEAVDLADGMDVEVGDILFNYQLTEEEVEELSAEKFKSQQRKKKKKKASSQAAQAPPVNNNPAPAAPPTPLPTFEKDNGARDFAIFLVCTALALVAFYFGLNDSHRKTFEAGPERHGRSIYNDFINPSEEKPKEKSS